MIACVTVPMAALERPENAVAAVPPSAPPATRQASSHAAIIAVTAETIGAPAQARGGAIREHGVTVFGVPGGLDATRGTARTAPTERTLASLVRAFRRDVASAEKERARERAAARERRKADPQTAICLVFGPRCREALRVAHCESRFDTNAQNGQYLGLFQMGSYERATYGHGTTPYDQAIAAYRYFVASGRDWGPWSCKP